MHTIYMRGPAVGSLESVMNKFMLASFDKPSSLIYLKLPVVRMLSRYVTVFAHRLC